MNGRTLFALAWAIFSFEALGQDGAAARAYVEACEAEAKLKSPTQVVIAFEGFGGFDGAGLRKLKGVAPGVASVYDIYPNENRSGHLLWGTMDPVFLHTDAEGRPAADWAWQYYPDSAVNGVDETPAYLCAKAWADPTRKNRVVVLGYSWGGHAANQLLEQLGNGYKIDIVATIDPRTKYWRGALKRTENASRWLNFIELNARILKGYSVPGADVERDLTAKGYDHDSICYAPEVVREIRSELRTN